MKSKKVLEIHACMKKLNRIYTELFIFIVILTGCSDLSTYSDILTVDVKSQINNPVTLKASDIISEMHYISLETTDSSLLSGVRHTLIQQNGYFLIRDKNKLYMFDNTGKYIRRIGNCGQGSEEYVNLNNFDADNDNIYLYDGQRRRILVYSYDNKYVRTIKIQSTVAPDVMNIQKLPEGFLCYQDPMILYKRYKEPVPDMILFDENGKEKKVLHYRTVNINKTLPFFYGIHFVKHKDKIFIYPPLQDTIFSVCKDNLNVEFVINSGEHAIYPEKMDSKEERRIVNEKGFAIYHFAVNDKYLILYGMYKENATMFMYDLDTKELKNVSKIINDMDNTYDIDISGVDLSDNRMSDEKDAVAIIEEGKIPKSINNIKEDDNQIIRISTLK
jgi:hypothetical protein